MISDADDLQRAADHEHLMPSGSVISVFMCSGDTKHRMSASAGGSAARIQPVMRPCAVTTRTCRFTLNRSRMTLRKIVEHLRQIAARLALREHRGHEELRVDHRYAVGEPFSASDIDMPKVLAVVDQLELRSDWLRNFLGDHLQAGGKRVTGAQRARDQIDGLGELLLE